ncbi:MAG: 50S ribosomal protein L10 [Cytophagales bacterium]|nr:MAG: 50S ribosomal protein L10 [Cytophagales bacterium]TAF60032.1 MAG: 50S ribosomal protein L10 [Cytophagales bacterium]
MTKDEKYEIVDQLVGKLENVEHFYIADTSGMTVAQINNFRRLCFESGVRYEVYKNSLIKKALGRLDTDYSSFNKDVLKGFSGILFAPESAKVPAELIKKYRDKNKSEKPVLKAASIDSALFIGDNQLDVLLRMKSKQEIVGEIIGLLQSPMRRVVGAVKSGGGRVAGVIKAIADK